MDDKTRTTKSVRFHLDLELRHPRNAKALRDFANVIEDIVKNLASVKLVSVTEIIPAEGDRFDWQGR